jgi:hypothetical protein
MTRDYIILLVALTIMGAGLTDGLMRAFDLAVGVAVLPVAVAWAAFAYGAYQKMVVQTDPVHEPESASA